MTCDTYQELLSNHTNGIITCMVVWYKIRLQPSAYYHLTQIHCGKPVFVSILENTE